MSELTHINCVALTARFPVGKPVVPAALMNRPTRGERRFAYWALAECILAYYVGTDEGVSEVLHVAGEKRLHRCVSRICDTGYIPLPRSLTRYARSFDCGERKWLTNGAEISWKMPGRYLTGK